ncbi:sex peptide receptor-like [Agrilus planipennis]|uniref:Sex peptide receptor-like n=1 Tax=Agrilus planipennis TaxID=224129 RepID=A0A1W4X0K7_AGRPL|nr:sex peptide receptor-like [Agrilus planipennis]XP_018325845.1 sex peptide receptor-like [Agrilus planipennis]
MNSSIPFNYSLEVTNVTIPYVYCNLTEFSKSYRKVHGYLSLFVCVFGSVTNILNVFVLTRKEMNSLTNSILTGLAVADLLVMFEYIPFASHFYLDSTARLTPSYFSYSWAVFTIFHALFTQIGHFISMCLTVILAIWRYIIITKPQTSGNVCSSKRTNLIIFMTYVLCPFVCSPLIVSHQIMEKMKYVGDNGLLIPDAQLSKYNGSKYNVTLYVVSIGHMKEASFWVYGVIIKLVPCILLTILSERIIATLLRTKKRRNRLLNKRCLPQIVVDGKVEKKVNNKEQQADRTTVMLLAVLFLFLLTEFPQAILGLLSVLLEPSFQNQCYHPLGDIMDILALTNSSINFVLYCTMSRQFRNAFGENLRPKIFKYFSRNKKNSPNHCSREGQFTQVTQV